MPGILLSLPFMIFVRKRGLFYAYIALLPLILFLIWRFIIPLANVRYLSAALSLAVVYGFCILSRFIPRKVIAFLAFASVIASISEFCSRIELIASLILTVSIFLLLINGYLRLKYATILFILFVLFGLPVLAGDYRVNEYSRYKNTPFWRDACSSWMWLNDNTKGENISYAGRPVPFPLYGSGFKNNVYYTSLNKIDPAKLHFYKNSRYNWEYDYLACHRDYEKENNYRGRADYSVWLDNLRRRDTDLLYLYSLHQIKGIEFPLEDKWAKAHPDAFEQVFSNEIVHIYKVK
jgi:hypothetical protein